MVRRKPVKTRPPVPIVSLNSLNNRRTPSRSFGAVGSSGFFQGFPRSQPGEPGGIGVSPTSHSVTLILRAFYCCSAGSVARKKFVSRSKKTPLAFPSPDISVLLFYSQAEKHSQPLSPLSRFQLNPSGPWDNDIPFFFSFLPSPTDADSGCTFPCFSASILLDFGMAGRCQLPTF